MLQTRRGKNRWLSYISGFLIALLFMQVSHYLIPEFISPVFMMAEAAVDVIDPNGDVGTNTGTRVTCTGTDFFECLDDAVRDPSIPSTAGDYVEYADGNQTDSSMTTISGVDTATAVAVKVYHQETVTNMTLSASLVNAVGTVIAGPTNFTNRSASQWDIISFTSLSLAQADVDGLRVRLSCTRSGGSVNNRCRAFAMYADVTYDPAINVTVASLGTQQDINFPITSAYVGGAFSIVENTSSRSVTGITVTENGTVDAQNNLSNIRLYYEYDTTAPYDCASESYNGTETQFGSTVTGGFSGANGTATFTDTASITTTQTMCVYVVLDVDGTASPADTVEIEISDPTTNVVASGSPIISPATAVLLPGTTTLIRPWVTQENYHWRSDDGSESTATSATGGSENTTYDNFSKGVTKRLRMAVSNEGNTTASAHQFRLEYAAKTTTCSAATGWTDVGAAGGDFDMSPTANLTDGGDTTNIAISTGGVSDLNTTFLTPNGGVRDTSSQTGSITLTDTQFVELEYALEADTNVTDGTTYCFRVTNAGTPLDAYTNYPEATIAADVTVDAVGTQTVTVSIPSTGQYAGGLFRVIDSTAGASTITSVTITAGGTVDAQTDISNIRLRYDVDTTNPYTCDDVSYSNTDTQFGSTATNFNVSNKAIFTGSVTNSPTETVCFYVEYDVAVSVTNGETLEFSIADPSTEVVITSASVAPSSPVAIDGTTTFSAPFIEQVNYHWRNNDGSESAASSATGGTENITLEDVTKNTSYRLRFAVANTGLATTPSTGYRLEWAQKVSTCNLAVGWERVDTLSDKWEMSPTGNLTQGADTTNIAVATGGVSDPATTFLVNNNGVADTNDTTGVSTLPADNFLELEYSIRATDDAVQGATYCFRVTAEGTELDNYTRYPEATIKLDTDFKVQRGVATLTGDTLTLTAGTDYEAPQTAENSFIRITNTQLTGAGPNTGNSSNNADDVTVYITNPSNIVTSVTLARGTGAAGNTRVSWEIIEYTGAPGGENEMIVRRQEAVSYGAANTTVSGTVTNTITDNTDVAIFITGQFNADAGRNAFHQGLSTAAWNTGTNQVNLTRGASGAVSTVSYAIVEFTGSNWRVQRTERTYTAVGTVETNAITAVNSLARTFLHTQKRTTQNNHADFGHEVWLSGIGQVSFLIDPQASTPAGHTSVAWIIENTQIQGTTMKVTRSNGSFPSAGAGPEANNINIGKTLDDLSITSLFTNNRSNEAQRSWPEPILGARIISTTQYELWRSDTSAEINYRTEVVEWPTAARKLEQNYFRIYQDNGLLTPVNAWPAEIGTLGENEPMTAGDSPMLLGSTTRIRMTLSVTSSVMPAGLDSFKLEYAEQVTTCSAVSSWLPLGEVGSTTALWRGVNNSPVDGTILSSDPPTGGDLLISIATVAGTYEEENNTAFNPYTAFPGDEIEYDWVVQHNGASDKTSYCFRMVEATGAQLEAYNNYPVLRTVGYEPKITNWRWYDDEINFTPTTSLAAENIAPNNIANQNILKLRVVLKESSGADGENVKFALQYSEYADFSQGVHTLTSTTSCLEDSLWCYADGAGVDNAVIDTTLISNADVCVSGVGNGCGTYNESTSTVTAILDHKAFAATEFEFTIKNAGARVNAVYYFRLYDVVYDEVVMVADTYSHPSLITEGSALTSELSGVLIGQTIAGVTTDVETTHTEINFGQILSDNSYVAAQEISVDSNATEGFQVFVYATQQLTNTYGDIIPPIDATNESPAGWSTACTALAVGCFGYHTTDPTLADGSGRFAPDDSYAALDIVPREIMYSSIPTNDANIILYRIAISTDQPAGDYQTNISYLFVTVF